MRSTASTIPSMNSELTGQPATIMIPTTILTTPEATIQPHPLVGRERTPLQRRKRPATTKEKASSSVRACAANTLLVLAGLSDTPEWSMGEGYDVAFMQNVESMTGLRFVAIEVEADAAESAEAAEEEGESAASPSMSPALAAMRLDEPQEFTLVPNGLHAFFSGVESACSVLEY